MKITEDILREYTEECMCVEQAIRQMVIHKQIIENQEKAEKYDEVLNMHLDEKLKDEKFIGNLIQQIKQLKEKDPLEGRSELDLIDKELLLDD